MEDIGGMTKHKKKAGSIIFVASAVVLLVIFLKTSAKETVRADETEETVNQAKAVYTEEYQDAVDEQLEVEKSSEVYTEDQMLIKENPYGTNTLSLYVYFTTEDPVSVSYNVSVSDASIDDF